MSELVSLIGLQKKQLDQLKAKEQECEGLRYEVGSLENDRDILKEQLDQLKTENEELTTINARLLGRLEVDETDTSLVFNLDKELRQKEKEFYTAIQKIVKLKQTLTEIKEICNNNDELKGDFNLVDCDKYKLGKHNLANKILQKISECEGNDG